MRHPLQAAAHTQEQAEQAQAHAAAQARAAAQAKARARQCRAPTARGSYCVRLHTHKGLRARVRFGRRQLLHVRISHLRKCHKNDFFCFPVRTEHPSTEWCSDRFGSKPGDRALTANASLAPSMNSSWLNCFFVIEISAARLNSKSFRLKNPSWMGGTTWTIKRILNVIDEIQLKWIERQTSPLYLKRKSVSGVVTGRPKQASFPRILAFLYPSHFSRS